jgi:thymidylate synthase (FAD)
MKVTLIGYTIADIPDIWHEDPEYLLAYAGRICYNSKMTDNYESTQNFITKRVYEGHDSILEHGSATILIEGISRACLSQLSRHRLTSLSVQSQRYIEGTKFPTVTPPSIESNPEALTIYQETLAATRAAYERLRHLGIPKEDARYILPNATATNLVITANFREWRHIIRLRGLNPAAQWEIRELFLAIRDILYNIAPSVFEDLMTL